MQGTENGRNSDHDALLLIKGLLESFIRETNQRLSQQEKDLYQLTTGLKDLRNEIRDELCKHDKRISPLESKCSLLEERMNTSKEDRQKIRQDLAELCDDINERIAKGDTETREESRRSIIQWTSLTGFVVGIVCTIIGIFIGMKIG